MGVKPRPPDNRPQDHFCWPAGQTPNVIKVFVSGIIRCGSWRPGDGMPSNGYFDCVRVHAASNTWLSGLPRPSFKVGYTGAGSFFRGRSSTGVSCFWHDDLYKTCKKYFSNQQDCVYYDFGKGDAWVTGYHFPWEVAELVMNAYWNDPNYECFPMPNEQLAIRVARISDGTNIMIKFDHTL